MKLRMRGSGSWSQSNTPTGLKIFALLVALAIIVGLLFLFVLFVKLTYNASITKMSEKDEDGQPKKQLKEIDYWTTFFFVIFIALLSSVIVSGILGGRTINIKM